MRHKTTTTSQLNLEWNRKQLQINPSQINIELERTRGVAARSREGVDVIELVV